MNIQKNKNGKKTGTFFGIMILLMILMIGGAFAATGEGSATLDTSEVEISSSTVFNTVLTVGASGIAIDADNPTFTIPSGFTVPHANGGASVPIQVSEVDADGEWFVAGAGGTCAVTMGTSSASGQVITVDVTGACVSGNTITLTYKGSAAASASAASVLDIKTDDTLGGGAAISITTPPTIAVYGTSVFAGHAIAGVATTNNLVGLAKIGGTDLVLGGFQITAAGEDISLTTIRTTVTLGTMTIGELTNLKIVADNGAGGGVANNGVMEGGELSAVLATIASPTSGNNDFTIVSTVTSGQTNNYFIVGTIADTVSHGDTLDVEATGGGSVSSGATSTISITSSGTSGNDLRTITDTTAPTFTADRTGLNTIVLTFSEAITASDAVTGAWTLSTGTVSSVTQPSNAMSLTITTSGITSTDAVPTVTYVAAQGTVVDGAGNEVVDGTNAVSTDSVAPTVGIVFTDTDLKIGETSLVTFTFSEAVTGFDNSDLTIANGILTVVADQGSGVWTATFTPTADLEDAINVISVAMTGVTDVAGNAGVGLTDSNNYAIDTLAPASPVINMVATDDVINAAEKTATVSVNGTNELDSTVTLNGNAVVVDTTTTWHYVLDAAAISAFGEGAETLTAVATDAAGNVNIADGTRAITVDTLAPVGYTISIDQSFVNNANKAVTSFTFAGAEVGAGYIYSIDDTNGGTAAVTGTGIITTATDVISGLDVSSLDDDTLTYSVILTDVAGNAGIASTDTVTKDTLAPTLPTNVDVSSTNAAPTYAKSGDTITITATVDSGTTVTGTIGGQATTTNTVSGTTATLTRVLDGTETELGLVFTLISTDAAGNSAATVTTIDSGSVTIDFTAPVITSVSIPTGNYKVGDAINVTIISNTGYTAGAITVNDVAVTGFIEDTDNGGTYYVTYTVVEGNTDRAAGTTPASVVLVDAAGNSNTAYTSVTEPSGVVTIDANSPTGTVTLGTTTLYEGDLVQEVTITYDEAMSASSTPTITFTGATGLITSNSDGAWSSGNTIWTESFTLNDANEKTTGITVASSLATDVAGNVEGASTSSTFNIDTVAPAITSVTSDATAAGVLKVGNTITFTVTPTFTEAGLTITPTTYNGGILTWSTADSGATYTATYTVVEGNADQSFALQLTGVSATDAAGNTGATVDGTDVVKTIDANSPTGTVTLGTTTLYEGDLVQEVTITYDEAMSASSTPTITFTGATGLITSNSNGAWSSGNTIWTESFTLNDANEKTTGITVASSLATDVAGNVEGASTSSTFNIDTVAPAITSVISDATAAVVLKVGDTIKFTVTPTVQEAGLNITPTTYNGGILTWSTADSGATYTATYTVVEGNADQSSALQLTGVSATDAAGNTGATVDGTDVLKTIDANTPQITINTLSTSDTTPFLTGTIDDTLGITFDLDITGGQQNITVTNNENGTWISSAALSALALGTYTVTLTATDVAGNSVTSTLTDGLNIADTTYAFFRQITQNPRYATLISNYELSGITSWNTFTLADLISSSQGVLGQRLTTDDVNTMYVYDGTSWTTYNTYTWDFNSHVSSFVGYYVFDLKTSAIGKYLRHN